MVPEPHNGGAVSVLARKLLAKVKWSGLAPATTAKITFPDQPEEVFAGFGGDQALPLPEAAPAAAVLLPEASA